MSALSGRTLLVFWGLSSTDLKVSADAGVGGGEVKTRFAKLFCSWKIKFCILSSAPCSSWTEIQLTSASMSWETDLCNVWKSGLFGET